MFATGVLASGAGTGTGTGPGGAGGATAIATAMSKQTQAASSSKFKPVRAVGASGGLKWAARTTADVPSAAPAAPTQSAQPSLSILTSPLNRLASRPASELIGARQSRYSSKPLPISTILPVSVAHHATVEDVDDDSSLLSLLFSPTTPTEQTSTTLAAPAHHQQQLQRTPPIRVLPRTASTSPTRTPPSPTSAARLAAAADAAARRTLPPRFPLRPTDVKAEFIILNTAAATLSSVCDSGIDRSSSTSASDHDAILSGPELASAGEPPMVTSFKSVVKVETGLGADSNTTVRLKRPRVKHLRKPTASGDKSKEKKRIKRETGNVGFYSPLRATDKPERQVDRGNDDDEAIAPSSCSSESDSNQPLDTPSPTSTTLKGKGKAKATANPRKRRRSDSLAASSDGNDASREASPEHPADTDAANASGPAKVRKNAKRSRKAE